MKKLLITILMVFMVFVSGCNVNNNLPQSGNKGDQTITDNSGDKTDDTGDNMVRTVLEGQAEVSLPHYISAEIERSFLIDTTISTNVYLGHPKFTDSVNFSEFTLGLDDLQGCSFSIVFNYNGSNNIVAMENVDYLDSEYSITISDLYNEDEYSGTVVNYSKYHKINLDFDLMKDVSYGFINIELHIKLADATQSIVTSTTLYYSVAENEVIFGLSENPVLNEGETGAITNGWTYTK